MHLDTYSSAILSDLLEGMQGYKVRSRGWVALSSLICIEHLQKRWAILLSKSGVFPQPFVYFSHLFWATLRKMNTVDLIVF